MTKRMLIDATHPEETRVVVLDGNRLEEFDVETSTKRTFKGNIYLAKVVRVEPSLQAAFVEYGGNRHGFLAFGEIHPDYYQIPVADRQRLLEMAAAEAEEEAAREEAEAEAAAERGLADGESQAGASTGAADGGHAAQPSAAETAEAPAEPLGDEATPALHAPPPADPPAEALPEPRPPAAQPARIETDRIAADPDAPPPEAAPERAGEPGGEAREERQIDLPAGTGEAIARERDADEAIAAPSGIETVAAEPAAPETLGGGNGSDQGDEERPRRIAPKYLRNYKIQEVIKRRQILLVQVVKEERGTKGAALTTYLSLAGRYCVLMPNTPRGGGISRKITSAADRKRLREVMQELAIPDGMGLIVRTAGANRPKPEIKRDCEYLLRLWDDIREKTLSSVAPALIYEEANLIKRSIRDVYSRDIDEVLVDGEDAYRAAKDFMRMLMPSHARKVQIYRDGGVPLFARAGVEAQLDAMHNKRVELRSGGYIIIDQTEALVAIDVNSGRATRERNIEETALRTNLEAADEIARQVRLRDLAGLIVIDFIDMESSRNNAAVERRLKEALKQDRARIQVGRISHFGLLEMSRQRLRPSLTETAFVACQTCGGTGLVRSVESSAVHVLRAIEEEAAKRRATEITVRCAGAVAFYLLNHKRARLAQIEEAFGLKVVFAADETLLAPALRIERTRAAVAAPAGPIAPLPPPAAEAEGRDEADEAGDEETEEAGEDDVADEARADGDRAGGGRTAAGEDDRDGRRRRRRRRRRGRREDAGRGTPAGVGDQPDLASSDNVRASAGEEPPGAGAAEAAAPSDAGVTGEGTAGSPAEGTRRGRRGGRRRREEAAPETTPRPRFQGATPANPFGDPTLDLFEAMEEDEAPRAAPAAVPVAIEAGPPPAAPVAAASSPMPETVPARAATDGPPAGADAPTEAAAEPLAAGPIASAEIKPIVVDEANDAAPKKRGWWRR